MFQIITRDQAIKSGLKRYFDNNLCNKKHISQRRTSNGACIQCRTEWQKTKIKMDENYKKSQSEISKRISKRTRLSMTETDKIIRRSEERKRYWRDIEKSRQKGRIKQKKKRACNNEYRIKTNISWYMWRFCKKHGIGTSRLFETELGYSISNLKSHLEKQFHDGMGWENYGRNGWHIDHIIPISKFNNDNKDEFRACWALSNLRPLWGSENRIKNNKIQYLL